tara:strand:- start:6 stop:512 length:507 start_codon:yes stop_codon:yes gene_type:complete
MRGLEFPMIFPDTTTLVPGVGFLRASVMLTAFCGGSARRKEARACCSEPDLLRMLLSVSSCWQELRRRAAGRARRRELRFIFMSSGGRRRVSLILSERQGLVEDPGDDQDLGRGEEREGEGSFPGSGRLSQGKDLRVVGSGTSHEESESIAGGPGAGEEVGSERTGAL